MLLRKVYRRWWLYTVPTPLTIDICNCKTMMLQIISAAFTLTPINATVCTGSTVQFVCSATDVIIVSYSLNSKPLPPNANISAPTYIGGATIVNMSISNASANADITCRAYLVNGAVLTREAYLIVQGQACMNINLTLYLHCSMHYLAIWNTNCPATLFLLAKSLNIAIHTFYMIAIRFTSENLL